jgi:hypothetical protein
MFEEFVLQKNKRVMKKIYYEKNIHTIYVFDV